MIVHPLRANPAVIVATAAAATTLRQAGAGDNASEASGKQASGKFSFLLAPQPGMS
jgi:hypothetical protein